MEQKNLIVTDMIAMGTRARHAQHILSTTDSILKIRAIEEIATRIQESRDIILEKNSIDMTQAKKTGISPSMIDRLLLDNNRIQNLVDSLLLIAHLPDPVGSLIKTWNRPNGLQIDKIRTPLGVIGVIYESRPNVTTDAAALCLKSGNAVILRCGSNSIHSCLALHSAIVQGLLSVGLPQDLIQIVKTTDRAAVGEMLKGLKGTIDVIIPRGGKKLVARVHSDAKIPVFAHLEGLCHIYVDQSADQEIACRVVANAKMRRTGICGAAETLLVDRKNKAQHLIPILNTLTQYGCEIRATQEVQLLFPKASQAKEEDWHTEYLDAIISVKLVNGVDEAIEHINYYSSHHTEAIIANDLQAVQKFFHRIDSAILLHNASTQFADGGEFGFGSEIGIATGHIHARGPIGIEQLTTFKYCIHGNGQIRQ
ncbi:MAG: glutamate-5-semialdehyde dehydrogenase [Candidatus Tokpelaia sp. JSC161]|nr:MAG: glutamate-5-semialdehyde dehydrogenase [Candidatus Tokpelaia sp. JSC161]